MFLVDSGASNNFLSLEKVKQLGLEPKPCSKSTVKLADGKKLISSSFVSCLVSFGVVQAVLHFEILDCAV